ncbi:MAG: cupin domain-containing protein [Anaerolineae bacterium]|nr:cupin domain-containing protein [Anaerolineae bacterium]
MTDIPADSIVSRTFHKDAQFKAVLFGFDAGQSLSEHSAGQTAVIHILSGTATITLGEDTFEVGSGAWMHLPPRLKHSVLAKSPLVMLLLLVNAGAEDAG